MLTSRTLAPKTITLLLAAFLLGGCFSGPKKARILDRADRYFKSGEYDKAKVEYLNLLRLDNQNAYAFQQLGLIWVEQGVPLRALPFLVKGRELASQNVPVRVKLAQALAAVGQFADARKEAVSILQQDQSNSEAIGILADASRSKEDIAAAEQQLHEFPQQSTAAFHLALASLAMRKNDVGVASDEIQQALALEPNSAKAHLARGYLYLLRKNPAHAGPELKAASDLAPVRSEERIKYAEFEAANGAADEAKALLQNVTRQAPDYVPAWRDLAQIALAEKKYDEALTALENVFGRDPENPEGRLLQAEVWLGKADPKKAIEILDKLDSTYPNNPLVKYNLARAYLANNNTIQATAALEQAITIRPDYPEAILVLGELNLRAGKAQATALAMEDLLKKRPDLPQARSLLANCYQVLGRLDDAAALFREQTKEAPQSPEAYFNLGLILRQEKKNDEARQAFEKSSELAPDNFGPINQLVELDLTDKHYDLATKRVNQLLTKHPEAAASHFLEAKTYAAQREWGQAETALQKAIELDPNFTPAYELLVSAYVSENKLSDAISQLKKESEKNPNNPIPLLMTAIIYERMKDYPNARDAYEKGLTLRPDSVLALNNLAYLYAEHLNRLDRAYELAQKARNLHPGDGMIADTFGWVVYKRGDYQQALASLQDSAAKFPDNPEVQYHLGMAQYMMGNTDQARAALQKAVRAESDFAGKDEAQKRLAQLENPNSKEGLPGQVASKSSESNDVVALLREADSYEKQGDSAKAAVTYEHAFKVNPKLGTTALKIAQLNSGPLHQPGKALEFARKARDLAPNDLQVGAAVGRIALQCARFDWAYSLLQESTRAGNANPSVLEDFAMTNYALGRVSDARRIMEQALKANPDAAQSENGKRFLAMTASETPSQSEVEGVLKTQPDYVPALMAQAGIDLQQNKGDKAASIYEEVLSKYPDFAPAQKQLAASYAGDSGKLKQAYELAMKARKALPDDPELARTLAELSFKRNEFSYAAQLFQESNAKQPLPAKDLYCLGMAQLQSRQEAQGRKTLEQALAAGLSDPLASEVKKRLSEQPPK